jgi:hypothetical protein
MSRISLGAVLVSASLLTASITGLATADPAPVDDTTTVVEEAPTADPTDAPTDAPVADQPVASIPEAPQGSEPQLISDGPYNDSFAKAAVFTGFEWSYEVYTTGATTQTGENNRYNETSAYRMFGTVWAKWKAPESGSISVDTFGGTVSDTGLAIYTGSKITNAKRLAVNDDSAPGSSESRVTSVKVVKGATYYIQVGSSASSAATAQLGTIQVNLKASYVSPSNDNKNGAKAMAGTSWAATGTTRGATIERSFEPVSNPNTPSATRKNSVWWKWTAAASGIVTFSTAGSTAPLLYATAYDEDPVYGFTTIPNSFAESNGSQSPVLSNLPVKAGHTYYFVVGDTGTISGEVKAAFVASYSGPLITKLGVTSGKRAGGNTISIAGAHLTNVDTVMFGTHEGTNIVHISDTKITVKVPMGVAKGKVPVVLYVTGTPAAVNAAAHYTYK